MEVSLRRRFARKAVKIPVALDTGRGGEHESQVFDSRDISPIGVCLAARDPMPVGTNVTVRMILPSSQRCQTHGVVLRHTGTGMVVKFDRDSPNIVDEFSYIEYLAGS